MFNLKSLLRSIGKKAIGFVKGLNGLKTASFLTSQLARIPTIGPEAMQLGKFTEPILAAKINKGMDYIDNYLSKETKNDKLKIKD